MKNFVASVRLSESELNTLKNFAYTANLPFLSNNHLIKVSIRYLINSIIPTLYPNLQQKPSEESGLTADLKPLNNPTPTAAALKAYKLLQKNKGE